MDRPIGELPSASAINDASLIPIEQSGDAMSVTGALVKSYAQGAITGLTATATTLAAGSQATVTKAVQNGTLKLTFGIPRGDTGATGPSGSGTGDMVASVYDPAGGARQVAFADEITQGMESFSRKNLLDNWYFAGGGSQLGGGVFPINQRGLTSYTATGVTLDRWTLVNTRLNLALQTGGLAMTRAATGTYAQIRQLIENPSALWGNKVTLSVLLDSSSGAGVGGGIYAAPTVNASATYRLATLEGTGSGLFTVTAQLPEYDAATPYVFIMLGLSGTGAAVGDTALIRAVKLELGENQSLARQVNGEWIMNEIPSYQEQLSRCQRYLYVMNTAGNAQASFGVGQTSANTEVQVYIPFPVTMREAPTFSSAGSFETTSGGVATSVNSLVCPQARNTPDGALVFTMDTTRSLTPGTAARLVATSASARLIFSAEI